MRFLHAANEDSLESGQPLTPIALYTDPDRGSRFVGEVDEAVSLGSRSSPTRSTGGPAEG